MKRLMWAVPGLLLGLQVTAMAQVNLVPDGTEVVVRTNESIDSRDADGRIYTGTLERDILDRDGNLAIPRGSQVELVARRVDRNDMVLDLESIAVNGRRYSTLATEPAVSGNGRRQGIGANERTGKFVGGGAIIGSIVGAIAGGGKGAAIGAAAGAAAGASAQVATRGAVIHVPYEAMLTFRLERPLQVVEGADPGYMREGHHYHPYRDEYGQPRPPESR